MFIKPVESYSSLRDGRKAKARPRTEIKHSQKSEIEDSESTMVVEIVELSSEGDQGKEHLGQPQKDIKQRQSREGKLDLSV